MPHVAAGRPAGDRDTGRYQSHRPEQTPSIRSLTSITRHSLRLWQSRGNCRAMCNGNLKNFSKARDAAPAGRASRGQRLQSMPTRSTLL